MTTPAAAPVDDATTEAVITAVTASILAGATVAEIKAALLSLTGMTLAILDRIFRDRKLSPYVVKAVTTAVSALPAIVTQPQTPAAPTPEPAPPVEPAGPSASPVATAPTGGASPLDRPYIPTSVLDQVNAALTKKGKARPSPKKHPAASTFIKLKAAVAEAAARAGYLTQAARRMQAAYDTLDKDVIAAANATEDRYAALHEQAVKERARAVRAVAKLTANTQPDVRGEILLGWYAHISPATCKRCLAADGRNFNALDPPPIGYPGAVHPNDHCLPGVPHDTDRRVEDVANDARVALAVATRALIDLRLRSTKGQAMTETRTAVVTEVRGPTTDKPDQKPGFTARAVQYGVEDTYHTSWQRGVFKESLETRLPSVVWNHDWADPVGRVVSFRDSNDGLDIDVELDDFDAVPRARQAHAQLKSGTMSQFSFAFKRSQEEPDPKISGCTRIVKADVDEFSIVLNGSVPGTHVTGVRTAAGTVDAKTAADVVTRFAAGGVDLVDALTELRSAAAGESRTKPEAPAQRLEFRVVSGEADPDAAISMLADVDAALVEVAGKLSIEDVQAARRYFSKASSRLSELLYLLGMTPGVADQALEQWRGEEPAEVRTLDEPVTDADNKLFAALDRLGQRRR